MQQTTLNGAKCTGNEKYENALGILENIRNCTCHNTQNIQKRPEAWRNHRKFCANTATSANTAGCTKHCTISKAERNANDATYAKVAESVKLHSAKLNIVKLR